MNKYFFYTLTKDNIPFYFGVTRTPKSRLRNHKKTWGNDIKMEIKDECTGSRATAMALENLWVSKYLDMGISLKNKNAEASNPPRYCLFCKKEVFQVQGKRRKEYCNGTCRSQALYYRVKEIVDKVKNDEKLK